MRSAVGAVLIITASGGLGMMRTLEMRRVIKLSRDLFRILDRMQTEVCLRRTPLPQVLYAMEAQFPSFFRDINKMAEASREETFITLWCAVTASMRLPRELETPMLALGRDLSEGQDPERSFTLCRADITEHSERIHRKAEESGRLYPALGFAAGCLAVILLW